MPHTVGAELTEHSYPSASRRRNVPARRTYDSTTTTRANVPVGQTDHILPPQHAPPFSTTSLDSAVNSNRRPLTIFPSQLTIPTPPCILLRIAAWTFSRRPFSATSLLRLDLSPLTGPAPLLLTVRHLPPSLPHLD